MNENNFIKFLGAFAVVILTCVALMMIYETWAIYIGAIK